MSENDVTIVEPGEIDMRLMQDADTGVAIVQLTLAGVDEETGKLARITSAWTAEEAVEVAEAFAGLVLRAATVDYFRTAAEATPESDGDEGE